MIQSGSHCSHDLTEAFQVFSHIINLGFLLFQKLIKKKKKGIITHLKMHLHMNHVELHVLALKGNSEIVSEDVTLHVCL